MSSDVEEIWHYIALFLFIFMSSWSSMLRTNQSQLETIMEIIMQPRKQDPFTSLRSKLLIFTRVNDRLSVLLLSTQAKVCFVLLIYGLLKDEDINS